MQIQVLIHNLKTQVMSVILLWFISADKKYSIYPVNDTVISRSLEYTLQAPLYSCCSLELSITLPIFLFSRKSNVKVLNDLQSIIMRLYINQS